MDTSELLKRLKKIDPEALATAHDELIDGYDEHGQPISLGDPVFEIDGEMHRVPFQQLRDTLQGKEPQRSKPVQEVFRGRIPRSIAGSSPETTVRQEPAHDPSEDNDYYWDKNFNYEYMNPESKKQRVLGKIKK